MVISPFRSSRMARSSRTTRRRRSLFRPHLEGLEDRVLPATLPAVLTVMNLNDSGSGSLRQAILDANDEVLHPGPDVIHFDSSLAGGTITLTAADSTPLVDQNGIDFALGPSAFRISSAITIDGGSGGMTIARD